jgi:hypothetical protein
MQPRKCARAYAPEVDAVPLERIDGHLVAAFGGRYLIDTGSPASFSRAERVRWAGVDRALPTSALGLDATELSRLIDLPIDGLLGADVIGAQPFTIDLEQGHCSFGPPLSGRDRIEVALRLVGGVPLTTVAIDGVRTDVCIDTGARLSYLDRSRLAEVESVEEFEDFYPGFGAFRTAVHEVRVEIARFHVARSGPTGPRDGPVTRARES